jgi:2,3-bisphosphoglycerate-independent phosphoglycerate mutase
MKMKYALVIADGSSGDPLPEFGNKTSLEYAQTPHLDALAAQGAVGLAKTVPDGMEPSSNIACTSICGYDPALYPIGRGALEGAAINIRLADDEIALRLNLTHVSPEGIMVS